MTETTQATHRLQPFAIAGAGRKAGFVPPFVNKALAAQEGGEDTGPLSPKTMELLAGEATHLLGSLGLGCRVD